MTSLQYVTLREQAADKNFAPVSRQRYNFVYNSLSYAIDVYNNVGGQGKAYLLRFSTQKKDGM